MLNRKTLGRTGVEVTTVGLGCAYLGSVGDDFSEDRGLQTVWAALEAGVRLIDTAPLYQSTASERMVGRALRERPDLARGVVVETKCCRLREGSDYTYDAAMRSVEGSLERLQAARLELLYIHDPPKAALDLVMGPAGALQALRKLQAEGVVGHIGIASNYPDDNAPFVETGEFEIAVVPDAFSLLNQVALERILPAAERLQMGVVVATPLEKGLLAVGARGADMPGVVPATRHFAKDVLARVDELEQVCRRHGVSLLAAALQYVTRHPAVAATIPGARTPAEVVANAEAANQPIPEAMWHELQPLLTSWNVVARP
ncbi:MAG TPA: aldo/keto reductase [Chloroflexota bacterium]|nr:aldo/keto reductase [Chloroflexota bacterium]